METPTLQPYLESSSSSHTSSPIVRASPASDTTIKPLPALPHDAPAYTDEPYHDDPHHEAYRDDPSPPRDEASHQHAAAHQPYTDSPPTTPSGTNDENIPLAHFLLHQHYPTEAPPSYSVAIRQTNTHRDTLIHYIPSDTHSHSQSHANLQPPTRRSYAPVLIEFDPESGEVVSRTDDVRHSVENVVAMFVVAVVLLMLSGMLAWFVVGSGLFR
ncbi:hypothetical protein EK21DRAFT_113443 [Setomelanomma holmii]|uniref:Uncharacterized protein n=1 Tax=Setomelanomma holmii TaxID=210430 RepID=A0A9P4H8A4_9PLEO|nr:hypothetical protein EK21DRAFT_113443 [Setomelanomma holmii]